MLCYPRDEGKPGQRGSSAPTFRGINPKIPESRGEVLEDEQTSGKLRQGVQSLGKEQTLPRLLALLQSLPPLPNPIRIRGIEL